MKVLCWGNIFQHILLTDLIVKRFINGARHYDNIFCDNCQELFHTVFIGCTEPFLINWQNCFKVMLFTGWLF